ncbi:MAG: hypothetical protein K0S93_1142 [Nitrososphaeraceae archaeon]|jgi:hypothetical protein|nr:hypothetical protein [Nitrososphaeraceae archaeon]
MTYIINTELFKLKQYKINLIIIVIKFDIYYLIGKIRLKYIGF